MDKKYKRTERELPEWVREKISRALKSRQIKHTSEWNKKISDGQKAAWAKIPYKKTEDLSMAEYLGKEEQKRGG